MFILLKLLIYVNVSDKIYIVFEDIEVILSETNEKDIYFRRNKENDI